MGGTYEYDDEETLTQEDAWVVISSFFEDKGLVTQQLESFNEFVENSMQELVDEEGNLTLDQYNQHTGLDRDETVSL
jgi:DNA-directed RNA polymerase II subunit RPB2